MFVLVTGVTGRIGRNLARVLIARGDEVRGLVLPDDPGRDRAAADGVDCLVGNLRDPAAATAAVAGVEAVVHLGAMMLWGGAEHNPTLFEDNLRGTFNLAQAAATNRGAVPIRLRQQRRGLPLALRPLPADRREPPTPALQFLRSDQAGRRGELPLLSPRPSAADRDRAFRADLRAVGSVRPEGALGRFLFLQTMVGMIRDRAGEDAAAAVARLSDDERTSCWPATKRMCPYVFQCCDVRDLVQGLLLLLEPASRRRRDIQSQRSRPVQLRPGRSPIWRRPSARPTSRRAFPVRRSGSTTRPRRRARSSATRHNRCLPVDRRRRRDGRALNGFVRDGGEEGG